MLEPSVTQLSMSGIHPAWALESELFSLLLTVAISFSSLCPLLNDSPQPLAHSLVPMGLSQVADLSVRSFSGAIGEHERVCVPLVKAVGLLVLHN